MFTTTKSKNRHPRLPCAVASTHPGDCATTPNVEAQPASRARRIISSGARSASGVSRRAGLPAILGLSASGATTASPPEVAPTGPGVRAAAEVIRKPKLAPGAPCALCMDAGTCLELGRCARRLECNSPSPGRATKTVRRPLRRATNPRRPIRAGETVTVIRLPHGAAPFVEGRAVVKGAAAERHRYRVQFDGDPAVRLRVVHPDYQNDPERLLQVLLDLWRASDAPDHSEFFPDHNNI
jgi:hypothetical protein